MTPSQEAIRLGLDPYAVLGVPIGADEHTIKRAWRSVALMTHPDHNPDNPTAEEAFKRANLAWQVIGDPDERRRYDIQRAGRFHQPHKARPRSEGRQGFGEDWIRRNRAETERRRQVQQEKLRASLASNCYLKGLCDWMVGRSLLNRRGPSPWMQEWGYRVASDAQVRAIGNLWWVLDKPVLRIPSEHRAALQNARAHASFIKRAAASDLITLLLTLRDVTWPLNIPTPEFLRQGGVV